jgi:serine/threonine protein kinase
VLSPEAAEALAGELVAELIHRWRQGERIRTEDFLARHPQLGEHPEAVAELIYEELCLRQEFGAEVPPEELLRRFPAWRPQLEVLVDCQRLLGPRLSPPQFPAVGETLGDFLLLAELGGGAQGRVFLAGEVSLGHRPVVLKLTSAEAREHLALARLQHTHIVPLYSVQNHPARGLRALCMPYFGGAALAKVLDALRRLPPARRTGRDVLGALDQASAELPGARGDSPNPARQFLADAGYVEALCWLGACLADALQYAHERGLVHLDLKPSNVLLAADGQPMLLDFHLARGPVQPDGPAPPWLGGTEGYMSPEQRAALAAVRLGRRIPLPVDGRSDVYSLGIVLEEALGGLPGPADGGQPLRRRNPQVGVGLADIIAKCLAPDPADRYPHMAGLAADLRRHLAHRPLVGVRNRSVAERWRKWRRRRPHGLALAAMLLAALTAAAATAAGAVSYFGHRTREARTALGDGQAQMDKGQWDGAITTLRRGLAAARDLPFQDDLARELDRRLGRAERARAAADRAAAAAELHRLAERARFLYGADPLPSGDWSRLAASCRALWEGRRCIMEKLAPPGRRELEVAVRDDLLDLAIFWADLQTPLAPVAPAEQFRRQALEVLDQAEDLLGPSPVLDAERRFHGGPPRPGGAGQRTAWEYYALGRCLLRSGQLEKAARAIGQAVRQKPHGLWPNFYQGLCAYRRGMYADAVTAYSVCIGAAPRAAGCFFNRGRALAALGETSRALDDYDQALRLDPTLAAAALNRGMLHYRARRYPAALADLGRARELGADPAVVCFDLALVHAARGERAAALDHLGRALRLNPDLPGARRLRDQLRGR